MAEDCPDGDYLGAYSRFFSVFVARVNPYDQLPVSVSSYNVTEAEIVGEIINVTLQYLNQTQCPASLQAHLVHQVIQEIKSMCKKQPEDCGFKSQEKTYASLKLMQAITGKVNEICTRYLDNSRLALLPPPPSTPLPQVAAGGSKNCRRKMEDRYVVLHDLHTIFGIEDDSIANYYAVFDGHAGQDAAVYCATHLHQYLAESIYYPTDPERALRDAFLTTDTQFVEKSKTQKVCGGTTAVCTIILNKRLYVAWVGDSIATLIKRDNIVQLVNPHRLHREDEVQRIRKTGGVVMQSMGIMRVNGVLSVSRAIGDFRYKPFVTGEPEIKSVLLDGTEDFLVLATDGLTDYLEPGDIATALYHEIHRNPNGFKRAHQILLQWAKQAGSKDNITVVVVLLTPASVIAARPLHAHPYHSLQVNDILEKMNSKDKPMFLGIDDAHNAINSNILKQSMIGQEPRDHEDDGILAASNGKHENGDADYDYSDLGPETDVDAIDDVVAMPVKNLSYDFYKDTDSVHHEDVVAMPVKNLSYEFYKDTEPAHDHDNDDQPDNVTNVLDNMDLDESGNANINVNANVMHESIAANNLHENDEDDDEDEEDEDEDEDDNDNNVREDNEICQGLDVSGEVAESVHQGEEAEAHVREVIREEMDNKVREQLEGNTDDEETQVKMDDYADDAVDVVDEAAPLDYDESPPSPQANKPLQHALINEADNVADSEDSEDEWNYYRVDPNKEKDSTTPVDETQEARNEEQTQISEPPVDETELKIQPEGIQEDDIKCKSPQEESPELINTEISAEDKTVESEGEEKPCAEEQAKPKDMNFPLNPDAAEFVPGSPQLVDTRMNLVEDYPVSGSPFKQVSQMDDIQVPSQSEFEKEVSQRPREVDVEEKEYQNGDDSQRMDYADFISERQKVIGTSANLDDSEISSTKAEYGDESTASFIMTSEFHKTGISTIDESFSSSERDYDIAKDPMAMSFTPSDFEAAFDRGLDLNAVHNLSNTDLDEKNNSMEKEEDLTIEYGDLKVEPTNLMSTSDIEEPMDKPAPSEEPAELVNLSCQHEDNEDTFVEHAGESKITTIELLNLRPQSPQMEQQETARYDHSPSTENYSAEFESEKEPISVDNEQPLSPSSADIDETKPIDEASEDAALPVSDFQKETCSNEADTPSSLSPVPDAMESDLVAPAESAEIQSLLHADAPEFKPGQYSFQSFSMKSSEICEQPSPTETVDVCKTLTTEQPALDSYEPYSVETDNASKPVKQDLAKNLELEEKEIDDELVCAKPPVQESLLDFTEEKDVCTKPPQMQCELTPPLSPQEVEEKVIEDVVCPVESTVVVEQKQEEVFEDKTKEIREAMEDLVEPMKAAESMEAVDTLESLSGRTLNLSDSMQEFTGLESQLQPKEDEVPAANVIEDVQEEVAKKDKLINITEPEEPAELVIEETCKIQEKMDVQALPPEVEELEAKEPEVGQFDLKELEMKEPEPKQSEIEQFEVKESKVNVDAMESEIQETEVVKNMEIKEPEFVKEPEIKEMEAAKEPEVKELEIKEPEIKELELKELEIKEPDVKEPKAEESAIKEPEFKEPEVKESEVKEPEVKEPEFKEPEVEEPETKEPEIEVPEVKELEVKEPEVMKSEIKEPEVKEPEIRESDVQELQIEEPKIKEPETVEPEVKEPEVPALEIKEPEVKGPEMKEPEIKEPEIKEPEMKEPEVKELEIKEPEVKELEDKKLEIQEPEKKESVEMKEPEVEQKIAEVSENKVVESAAAAAAIAATAAVAAGAVAAQSKAKAKTTSAKPTKTATLKTTAPKSTPTSPSKTMVSATRTSTTATKKVASSTPTRPKDLDAPKKSPAPSTVSSKPSAPKTASKTTTSTATAKPATRLSAGQVSKPKPATASSKPPVADKKPTANGDVKSLSKPAASKPPSKTPPPTKTTLVKASTGRTSTGSAPTTKPKPASTGTASKLSTAAKSSTTATTTSTTTTAKPKTAPAVGNAMKTRSSTAKPPIIDKQVKETANKQISMSRTNTGASKVTSRLSAASSPATKRLTSSPKTTATSPSAKKTISKASKTSTGGKTQTDKGKIVQNGVSEKVEINTIIDDVPKKDLSPMVAPDDNQLIMSSD